MLIFSCCYNPLASCTFCIHLLAFSCDGIIVPHIILYVCLSCINLLLLYVQFSNYAAKQINRRLLFDYYDYYLPLYTLYHYGKLKHLMYVPLDIIIVLSSEISERFRCNICTLMKYHLQHEPERTCYFIFICNF